MCSQAWICCFCLVSFSGKREKAIHARKGLGKQLLKLGKLMDRLQSFFTGKFSYISHVQDAQWAWTLNWFELMSLGTGAGRDHNAWSCISQLILTSTDSHRHHSAPCKETLVWLLCPQAASNRSSSFAEGSKCCCSRHENPVNIPFQFD